MKVAFQGDPGANSHLACAEALPAYEPIPCATFEDAFAAVSAGEAALGMIPIENSLAGRVGDVHHLLPEAGLHIVGEHFMAIRHQLMGLQGATLEGLKRVRSHPMALGQCRRTLRSLGILPVSTYDTAGAAREVLEHGDVTEGAIASRLAAEIHGLKILRADCEDASYNTTRFVILAAKPDDASPEDGPCITSLVFRVRNVPAALYKALGGFATNGVNVTKLESYSIEGSFDATQFYADLIGHPDELPVRRALEELAFFSASLNILGVYAAHKFREAVVSR
jgi:prephenate dehydratase